MGCLNLDATKVVKRITKDIISARKDGNITTYAHDSIETAINGRDLTRRNQKTLDIRQEMLDHLVDHPEALENYHPSDVKFLNQIVNMTAQEVVELGEQVKKLREQGRMAKNLNDAAIKQRQDEMQSRLMSRMKTWTPQMGIVEGQEYMAKRANPVTKAIDTLYAKSLNETRFFDWLDQSMARYDGPFMEIFHNKFHDAQDNYLMGKMVRERAIMDVMKREGISPSDLLKGRDIPGIYNYSGEAIKRGSAIGIYLHSLNERGMMALKYGNFKYLRDQGAMAQFIKERLGDFNHGMDDVSVEAFSKKLADTILGSSPTLEASGVVRPALPEAQKMITDTLGERFQPLADSFGEWFKYTNDVEGAIRAVEGSLSSGERNIAKAILDDGNNNFESLDKVMRRVYNRSLKREESFSHISRLETSFTDTLIGEGESNDLISGKVSKSGLLDVAKGTTVDRLNITPQYQTPIDLNAVKVAMDNISESERIKAFAELARDWRAIIRAKDPTGKNPTIARMIRLNFGEKAAKTFLDNINIMTRGREVNPDNTMFSGSSSKMSAMALAFNFKTYIQMLTSVMRGFSYAHPDLMFRAILEATVNYDSTWQKAFEEAPQLKNRMTNYVIKQLKQSGQLNKVMDMGTMPISFMDQAACVAIYKAAKETAIRRGFSDDMAQRKGMDAVLLTQPAADIYETPAISRDKSVSWAMKFTSDRIAMFQGLIYEYPQLAKRILTEGLSKDTAAQLSMHLLATVLYGYAQSFSLRGNPDTDRGETWTGFGIDGIVRTMLGSIPLAGGALENWYRDRSLKSLDIFSAPIEQMRRTIKYLAQYRDEEGNIDYNSLYKGLLSGAGAVGYLTGKIPTTAISRGVRTVGFAMDQEYAQAFKEFLGIEHVERFQNVSSMLSKEVKDYDVAMKRGQISGLTPRIQLGFRFRDGRNQIRSLESDIKQLSASKMNEENKKVIISRKMDNIRSIKDRLLNAFDVMIKKGD